MTYCINTHTHTYITIYIFGYQVMGGHIKEYYRDQVREWKPDEHYLTALTIIAKMIHTFDYS